MQCDKAVASNGTCRTRYPEPSCVSDSRTLHHAPHCAHEMWRTMHSAPGIRQFDSAHAAVELNDWALHLHSIAAGDVCV